MRPRRVFLYVQHLLGIGHLVRTNRIAMALRDQGFDVTVAMGGMPVVGFPGPGIEALQLPPVKAGREGFSALEDGNGNPVDDAFRNARAAALLESFRERKPDVLIVEAFPFARRVMRFELLPLLEEARRGSPKPIVASSVRDILQAITKPGRAEEAVQTIEDFFDLILVHGDPSFASFAESFPLAGSITRAIRHTGLVAGPKPQPPSDRYDVIISAGGGAAGSALVEAAAAMATDLPRDLRLCLVTGPNLPDDARRSLESGHHGNLDIFAFRPDLPQLFAGASLSVSQAGYNTVCDLLRAGTRSLLVPFAEGGETEQTERAMRLERLGVAAMLPEAEISAERLRHEVERLLAGPPPSSLKVDLEGARHTAEIIAEKLDS